MDTPSDPFRWYERRYPPTPYPPRSEETRQYRDAWDLGWKHYASLRSQVLDYEAGLAQGPRKHGYRDGVIARYMFEEQAREHERQARQAEHREHRARLRAEADLEPPW